MTISRALFFQQRAHSALNLSLGKKSHPYKTAGVLSLIHILPLMAVSLWWSQSMDARLHPPIVYVCDYKFMSQTHGHLPAHKPASATNCDVPVRLGSVFSSLDHMVPESQLPQISPTEGACHPPPGIGRSSGQPKSRTSSIERWQGHIQRNTSLQWRWIISAIK